MNSADEYDPLEGALRMPTEEPKHIAAQIYAGRALILLMVLVLHVVLFAAALVLTHLPPIAFASALAGAGFAVGLQATIRNGSVTRFAKWLGRLLDPELSARSRWRRHPRPAE